MRRCGNFFDWPDQNVEELSAVRTLFESWGYSATTPITLRSSEEDPPDVVATDEAGNQMAIEVTELVDEGAARRNAQIDEAEVAAGFEARGIGPDRARQLAKVQSYYREWKSDEVIGAIEKLLSRKDGKTWHGGPYTRTVLLVPTDESDIDPEEYVSIIEAHEFPRPKIITEGYVLFSYDPRTGGCPVARLSFAG